MSKIRKILAAAALAGGLALGGALPAAAAVHPQASGAEAVEIKEYVHWADYVSLDNCWDDGMAGLDRGDWSDFQCIPNAGLYELWVQF